MDRIKQIIEIKDKIILKKEDPLLGQSLDVKPLHETWPD